MAYNDDQPRDENGQWGSGGGGRAKESSSSSGEAAGQMSSKRGWVKHDPKNSGYGTENRSKNRRKNKKETPAAKERRIKETRRKVDAAVKEHKWSEYAKKNSSMLPGWNTGGPAREAD